MIEDIIHQNLEEFSKNLNAFNITVSEIDFEANMIDLPMYGKFPGAMGSPASSGSISVTLSMNTSAFKIYIEYSKHLALINEIQNSDVPAVNDLYGQLMATLELTKK